MKINILLFATLKERTGKSQVSLDLPEPCTVSGMLDAFFLLYPALRPLSNNVITSVNQEFADLTQIIHQEDEIALFPPVSGG